MAAYQVDPDTLSSDKPSHPSVTLPHLVLYHSLASESVSLQISLVQVSRVIGSCSDTCQTLRFLYGLSGRLSCVQPYGIQQLFLQGSTTAHRIFIQRTLLSL